MAVREFNFVVGPETSELPTIGVPSSPDDLISQAYADARYTQGSEAVADNAALKAIVDAERRDGDFVLVKDSDRVYRFNSGNSDSDDGNFVLAPDAGTGRWLRVTILNKANTFTDTTNSTSKDTGSMILEGGLGVEQDVFIGGSINVTGDMTVSGTTTTINVDTMQVEDPNILLNSGGDQSTANTNKSGITVDMSDATNARIGYETSAVSKFVAGEVGSESEIITKASTQDITGKKTFDNASGVDFLENTEPSTPAASDGRLYFNSGDKTFHQKDDAGIDQSLVTESEFVNYIVNPSASVSKNDWTDTGTSTVSTRTTTSAELPREFERPGALKVAVGSSGTDYTYARFTLGNSDAGKHIAISWLQLVGSTYADGDLKLEVYTNAQADYLGAYTEVALDTDVSGDTDLKAAELSFYSSFRDLDTNPYYELRIVRKANGGGANDFIAFNEITVKPANINHAIRGARDTVTAAKTLAAYTVYLVDTSGGAVTLTLPPCKTGLVIGLVDISDSWGTNNITLTPDGSDTVDYDTIDVSGVWIKLRGNGTNWEIQDPIVPNSADFSGSVVLDGDLTVDNNVKTPAATDLDLKPADQSALLLGSDGSAKFANISTTASGANAFLDSGDSNNLLRSTSSKKYKEVIRNITDKNLENFDKIRPITYRSKMTRDGDKRYFGFIAEEMNMIYPNLVNFTDGKPDGVQYDRMVVMLVSVVQSLNKKVSLLEKEIEELNKDA